VTGGQLLGVDFARDYSGLPTPDCLRLGRGGEILQVGPNGAKVTCTIKPGTPIFVFGFGSACSDVEDGTPFFGENEAAQRRCAREHTHEDVLASMSPSTEPHPSPSPAIASRSRHPR
jgi:hypothetical protein